MKKEKPEGFIPLLKEKSNEEQFIFENNEWHKTNELTIMSMWGSWGKRVDGYHYEDEDGFFVYGYIKS